MTGLLGAFWSGGYAPHGYCLLWQPGLIATHIVADAVIALAYFSIPVALVLLVRRRRDMAFGWLFWCFAIFIFACGFTHLMSIWTLYQPVYWLEALVKVITAAASIATAIALWPLLPKAIAMPSADKLQTANAELAGLIAQRDAALEELRTEIGQREKVEAALLQSQKLEAVGQLTGGIAHDFNNLLQAIAGNLELISRRPDDPDRVVRWTGSALDAVERGRSLTGQLLAFSRRQRLELSSVRIYDLITGMRDLIERAVAPLSRVEIDPIDPTWNVEADSLQLELAILNLAFNARDAMPQGGVLRISAERRTGTPAPDLAPGDYVALTIVDTGTGMSPEVRARAVEPFFTTKGVGQGTGMGLSMAFGVVSQSGGTLTIDSQEGAGARITLFLRAAAAEPARETDERSFHRPVSLEGRRILLVDDDEQVRSALAAILEAAGAMVLTASDGVSGLAGVREHRPDLVIVDFAMPGMSGAEVARQVREIDGALPILIVTGFAESAQLDALDGIDVGVLRKPFDGQDLLGRAAELIAAR